MQAEDSDPRILEISGQLLGMQNVGQLRLAVGSGTAPRVWSLEVEVGPGKKDFFVSLFKKISAVTL
jgi:hypothetical protein